MRRLIVGVLAAFILAPTLACLEPDMPTKDDPMPAPVEKSAASKAQKSNCDRDRVPPDKPNLGKKRYVTIYGCVDEGFAPITLITSARDVTTGEFGEHEEPSGNTSVQYVVGYDSGHQIQMHVELKAVKPGSKNGFLYISDGPGNRIYIGIGEGYRAYTDFQPSR